MPGAGQQRVRAGMFGSGRSSAAPGFWAQVGNQARAAAEGALDTATFGLDDQAAASAHAIGDWLHGQSIGAAYRRRIAEQHQSDANDARMYGTARTLGTIGATGLELFLPGGALGAAARLAGKVKFLKGGGQLAEAAARFIQPAASAAKRIKQVTPLSGRESAVIGALGAGGGMAGQGMSDILHHRLSSLRDYAGAAAGGTAEALAALKGRPKLAAGLGGATTSVAQDLLNGRVPSAADAAKSAYASALLSAAASAAGTSRAARASIKTKEQLGETGSQIRTLLNFDRTISTQKQRFHLDPTGDFSEGYTYPDQRTASQKLIESKFGDSAHLSYRQRQAHQQLGSQYRVDHFLPGDVGSIAGFLAAQPVHDAGRYDVGGAGSSSIVHPFPSPPDFARFTPGFPAY